MGHYISSEVSICVSSGHLIPRRSSVGHLPQASASMKDGGDRTVTAEIEQYVYKIVIDLVDLVVHRIVATEVGQGHYKPVRRVLLVSKKPLVLLQVSNLILQTLRFRTGVSSA